MSDERADAIPEARWPIVTAWIKAEPGKTGASPVTLGVGRDGPQVGYYSGGRCPADRSEHEIWLRLDPHALAALPEVLAAAAPHMAGSGEAERLRGALTRIADGDVDGVGDYSECVQLYARQVLAAEPDAERAPQEVAVCDKCGERLPLNVTIEHHCAEQPEPRQDELLEAVIDIITDGARPLDARVVAERVIAALDAVRRQDEQ